MRITFEDQVAIVTGAARGLGRSYAEALAARGAKVVIADLGEEAEATAGAIRGKGGVARAWQLDVTDFAAVERMVAGILAEWGRIHIAINNAGILRDKSFGKMDLGDFRSVLDVHLMGSVHVCKAVWEPMREQRYGRILLTGSSSGMYGIFGQSNYGAAKAAMLGLMNVLHLEGERYGIRVNTLTPTAATRMTEGLLKPEVECLLSPDTVAPGALFLVSRQAPSRTILAAGGGSFARVYVTETQGVSLAGAMLSPEGVAEHFNEISDPAGAVMPATGFDQTEKLANSALRVRTGDV
jgi:NAD(P)-dependent dehydrogenase (short-subunit alcohol dehydrogenase family)